MNRVEKSQVVETVNEKFARAKGAFLTEYRGLNAEQTAKLRIKVREGGGEIRIVKNRLAKIAVKGTPFEHLAADLKGPIALTFTYGDVVSLAKALTESLDKESPFNIKVGSLEGKAITAKDVEALSKLPDKKTLLSMLLSAVQGPLRNFAGVISAVPRDFVNVLAAVKDKKEKSN